MILEILFGHWHTPAPFYPNPSFPHPNSIRVKWISAPTEPESGEVEMAKAYWASKLIAESNATVVLEGNQYFPPDAVKKEFLLPSNHTSICPWKGTAHYYHVEVGGLKNENAAWFYPDPKPAAGQIKDRIAFWKGVRVEP